MEYNKQYINHTSNKGNRYNDNQVASAQQSQLIDRDFRLSEDKKSQDLVELYEEMRKQREYLYSHNADHSLDNIIESTDNHISILSSMIKPNTQSTRKLTSQPNTNNNIPSIDNNAPTSPRNNLNTNVPQPHLRPYIPSNRSNPNNNTYNNNDMSSRPPNNYSNGSNLPNTNNNVPNIDNDTSNNINNTPNNTAPIPRDNNVRNRTRINARSSPLQSGIVSLAKAIFGKVRGRHTMVADEHRNRFHNSVVEVSSCNPHNKIITNECNILRLLLLYLTLHPHCRHCQTLSAIASERLEILTAII